MVVDDVSAGAERVDEAGDQRTGPGTARRRSRRTRPARCPRHRGRSRSSGRRLPQPRPARAPSRARPRRCPSHRPRSRSRRDGWRCGPVRTPRPAPGRAEGGRSMRQAGGSGACARRTRPMRTVRSIVRGPRRSLPWSRAPARGATRIVASGDRRRTGRPARAGTGARGVCEPMGCVMPVFPAMGPAKGPACAARPARLSHRSASAAVNR